MGKPLTVDISSDVKNLDQVIPGSACQPVSIVVPFHTHHSSLVGMAKFRKDCVKVKLNSHMLSSKNISIIAQLLAMTTFVHKAHGHTQNTAKWGWAPYMPVRSFSSGGVRKCDKRDHFSDHIYAGRLHLPVY